MCYNTQLQLFGAVIKEKVPFFKDRFSQELLHGLHTIILYTPPSGFSSYLLSGDKQCGFEGMSIHIKPDLFYKIYHSIIM